MSGDAALPEYVQALLDPAAYPHEPSGVELLQTHISWVFLAGNLVYKTKKPVDFGFIRQLEAETRERFCHAELRLNRRLAPGVYLDVVPVVRMPDGRHVVEGDPAAGEVVEHAVKMRRLPDDRTLDRLLAAGEAPPDLAERLARRLIAFHESAAVVPNDPDFAGASAERAWWAREYGEAAGFIGDTWLPEDATATRAFIEDTLDRDAALFDERLAAGRVIEGHGDLRAAHVYLLGDESDDADEAITIVDCIEFNEWFHFRYLDTGYDVAFLAMDLEALGHADLGDELAGRYLAASGDETQGVLQPLHRAYRAFVRGKVESIGAHAPETPEEQARALAASAARFFRLAASYAERRAAPQLVALSGLPASGKSTVAATLACRIGAAYLSSDVVRKQLAGIDPRERVREEWRTGLYAPEMTERTYAELRARAVRLLREGRAVVLDAMHGRRSERDAVRALAAEHGVPATIAELRIDDATAHARIAGREDDPLRTSDATWAVYEAQRDGFEPIAPDEASRLALDAARPPAALAREIADAVAGV